VTVLSRCLQFNLKPLPQLIGERIALTRRESPDAGGVALIARRSGSLRDGLSLLDQAIAIGVAMSEDVVRTMLGASTVITFTGLPRTPLPAFDQPWPGDASRARTRGGFGAG
jgi:DNA polymerase-3 subunit gamma/tau